LRLPALTAGRPCRGWRVFEIYICTKLKICYSFGIPATVCCILFYYTRLHPRPFLGSLFKIFSTRPTVPTPHPTASLAECHSGWAPSGCCGSKCCQWKACCSASVQGEISFCPSLSFLHSQAPQRLRTPNHNIRGTPSSSTTLVPLKDRVLASFEKLEGTQLKGRSVYLVRRSLVEDILNAAADASRDDHHHHSDKTNKSVLSEGGKSDKTRSSLSASSSLPQPQDQLALLHTSGFSITLADLLAIKQDNPDDDISTRPPPSTVTLSQTLTGLAVVDSPTPDLPTHALEAFDTVQIGDVARLRALLSSSSSSFSSLTTHNDADYNSSISVELVHARHPNHGGTLLHVAAGSAALAAAAAGETSPEEDICSLLLDAGADINALSYNGATPLHWAAGSGRADLAALLLRRGADAHVSSYTWGKQVFGKDAGQTPSHWAAVSGHTDVLKVLSEWAPLSLGEKDERGRTPTALAAREGKWECEVVLEGVGREEYVCVEVLQEGQAVRVMREEGGGGGGGGGEEEEMGGEEEEGGRR